jgi:hypothetical protein
MRQGVLAFFSQAHDGVHASFRMIVAPKGNERNRHAFAFSFIVIRCPFLALYRSIGTEK